MAGKEYKCLSEEFLQAVRAAVEFATDRCDPLGLFTKIAEGDPDLIRTDAYQNLIAEIEKFSQRHGRTSKEYRFYTLSTCDIAALQGPIKELAKTYYPEDKRLNDDKTCDAITEGMARVLDLAIANFHHEEWPAHGKTATVPWTPS